MDTAAISAGKVLSKVALNMALPGAGTVVDFAEAVYDVSEGKYISAVTNVVIGVLDLASLGFFGMYQAAGKEAAKQSAVNVVKETSKSTSKAVGKEARKQIAKGMHKGLVAETAKATAKQTRKELGKNLGKEIAKGMIPSHDDRK